MLVFNPQIIKKPFRTPYDEILSTLKFLKKKGKVKVSLYCTQYCLDRVAEDSKGVSKDLIAYSKNMVEIIENWIRDKKSIDKDKVKQHIEYNVSINNRRTNCLFRTTKSAIRALLYDTKERTAAAAHFSSCFEGISYKPDANYVKQMNDRIAYAESFLLTDNEWSLKHGFDLSNLEEMKIFLLDFLPDNNYQIHKNNVLIVPEGFPVISGETYEDLVKSILNSRFARGFIENIFIDKS